MTAKQANDNQRIKSYFDEQRSLERRQSKVKDLLTIIKDKKIVDFRDLGHFFNLGVPVYLLLSDRLGQNEETLFITVRDGLVPVKVLVEVVNEWFFGWKAPSYTVVGEKPLESRDLVDKVRDAIDSSTVSVKPTKEFVPDERLPERFRRNQTPKEEKPVKVTIETDKDIKTFSFYVKQAEIISKTLLELVRSVAKDNK